MRNVLLMAGLLGVSSAAQAKAPTGWSCDEAYWEDGLCDCGCVVSDVDCADGGFEFCERSGCGAGEVPWEHRNWTCMTSACGDGWRDDAAGEACDDGNALNRGGCSADCTEINEGWDCGAMALGCWEVKDKPKPKPKPEPKPTADTAEPATDGETTTDEDAGTGCSTAPVSLAGWMAGLLLLAGGRVRR